MNEKYKYVGQRIKKERLKYGLSLNELASATDLSPSFLSLLENGKTVPSLKVLDKLTTYFSIHIANLFSPDEEEDIIYIPANNQIEVAEENERVLKFLLPKGKGCRIEPVLVTLYPHSANKYFTSHSGLEFGYIIQGEIEVVIEGRESILCKEGDSIIYHASLNHKLINHNGKTAKGIWIGIPYSNLILNK